MWKKFTIGEVVVAAWDSSELFSPRGPYSGVSSVISSTIFQQSKKVRNTNAGILPNPALVKHSEVRMRSAESGINIKKSNFKNEEEKNESPRPQHTLWTVCM